MWYVKLKDELYHHGIEGQKWGVRRGPPYPIDDKVLKEGSRLNSVQFIPSDKNGKVHGKLGDYQNSGRWMYTYRPEEEHDVAVYEGAFSKYLALVRNNGNGVLLRYQYKTVKDLKMPTRKEREDEFRNLLNDPKWKKKVTKELSEQRSRMINYGIGSKEDQKTFKRFNPKKIKTDDDFSTAYRIFNVAMENTTRYNMTKEYSKRMSEKWDAMVDDNNQGVYNEARDPIIVFRANEALKLIADQPVVQLSPDHVFENYNKVREYMNSKGKGVAL